MSQKCHYRIIAMEFAQSETAFFSITDAEDLVENLVEIWSLLIHLGHPGEAQTDHQKVYYNLVIRILLVRIVQLEA